MISKCVSSFEGNLIQWLLLAVYTYEFLKMKVREKWRKREMRVNESADKSGR